LLGKKFQKNHRRNQNKPDSNGNTIRRGVIEVGVLERIAGLQENSKKKIAFRKKPLLKNNLGFHTPNPVGCSFCNLKNVKYLYINIFL